MNQKDFGERFLLDSGESSFYDLLLGYFCIFLMTVICFEANKTAGGLAEIKTDWNLF